MILHFKAVLFDLDGTLLDRDNSLVMFIRDQYDRLHQLHAVEKEIYVKRFIELDNYGYVWKDKVYQQLIDELGIEGLEWEWLLNDYIHSFKRHCVGYSNLMKMLVQLKTKQIKLALISNGYGQFQFDNFTALGITHLFDEVLISEWEGLRKPDPAIFNRALSKLGVKAKEAIFVGDHLENDIRASHNIGMTTIWKPNKQYVSDDVVANAIINDLDEIADYILSL